MSELQEIRRFWPWMRPADWFGDKRAFWARTVRGVQVTVGKLTAGGYSVSFFDSRHRQPSNGRPWIGYEFWGAPAFCQPTIAQAMRAAGFEVRGPSRFLNKWKRNDCAGVILPNCRIKPHAWFTPLADRQRPRKGARLGKRKRSAPDVWRNPYAGMMDYWYGTPFAGEKFAR